MLEMFEKSADRELLVERLHQDLVGPRQPNEVLSDRPSDVYLTGVLWPPRVEMTGEDDDQLATGGSSSATDAQNNEADSVPANYLQKPSVAGISFCAVSESSPVAEVTLQFGRYTPADSGAGKRFHRKQVTVKLDPFDLAAGNRTRSLEKDNPLAAGVQLHIRSVAASGKFIITVSVINNSQHGEGRDALEAATIFQTHLSITPSSGTKLVPKPAIRSEVQMMQESDTDELSNDLLFRDVHAFASGHVCAASWGKVNDDGEGLPTADSVRSSWIPSSIVPGVNPNGHKVFYQLGKTGFDPLSALALSTADEVTLRAGLNQLCECYASWIEEMQRVELPKLSREQLKTGNANLLQCLVVLDRMRKAVSDICSDPRLRRGFQLCNLAMHTQHAWDVDKSKHGALRWRPFQLGFLLLSAVSTVQRDHPDRETMDLLWFPTGGGKTEAYLALIALVAFYRRLSPSPADRDGVAAIMRYTLRLLTTQQFARSASMIVACEAIRTGKVPAPSGLQLQGTQAFSIGLWVGGDASPNTRANAYAALHGARELASPEQLAECPVCHQRLSWTQATVASPVIAKCENMSCLMHGSLPVWTVDEDVYTERPTLLIGTVDKFAQVVRRQETNALFGVATGAPPDLIIQDELHLISGPLGTIAAVYEAAFDILFSTKSRYPKIIGSTATIRRASEQVLALFDRKACQFPPAGINHYDSGFAVHDPESFGRRYVGVSTAGRSAKFTLQAVSASLLQSAAAAFQSDVKKNPYWTLLGYFNSLRELGGALVLMQDDVTDSIQLYKGARGEAERLVQNVEELTSRRTQEEIIDMLSKLAIGAGSPGVLDVVLATNMVSVGVDIPRLGLMVVNGQPKAIAEYIQATSRVGRGPVSGLVVSILNNAKTRDRSRFETFCSWHQTLYKDVEATSVTPFASRARDKALHAALVAAVRHLAPGMLNRPNLNDAAILKAEELIDLIVERAARIDPQETAVRRELERKLEQWIVRTPKDYWQDYRESTSLLISAERAAWKKAVGRKPGSSWPTLNSMRTVEAGTPFRLAAKLKAKGAGNGE
jgi:Helicase conserved C-terminal domain